MAHDVPGFITNRIGCFYFLAAMRAADEFGLSPDEADAVSGPLMGRSNSATYRTIDLVGVDILLDICDNTRAAVSYAEEKRAFEATGLSKGNETQELAWKQKRTRLLQARAKRREVPNYCAGHRDDEVSRTQWRTYPLWRP